MKTTFIIVLLMALQTTFAQEKLVKDVDFDSVNDTVYIDKVKSVIVCKLSTQQFRPIESKPVEINEHSFISESKKGFEFSYPEMRSGFSAQFRYDKKQKKIRLIGMGKYSLGNIVGDESGKSSVNLLTNKYIGNWNYYDDLANNEKGELVKIPTIKTKMNFGKIYLENFEETIAEDYGKRCAELQTKHEEKSI